MAKMKVELQYLVAYHTLQLGRWLLTFGRINCSIFNPDRGSNKFVDVVGNNLPACVMSQTGRQQT